MALRPEGFVITIYDYNNSGKRYFTMTGWR